jgi:primosomal protein N'
MLLQQYDTDSRVLRKIIALSSYSKTTLYVQTRLPKHPVLQIQDPGLYADWKVDYLKDLKEYFLPPFGVALRIEKKGYFTDQEKDIIDNALEGQVYTHNSFRSLSFVTARIKQSVWNDTKTWLPYKLSLLRATCDVFIE